MNIVWLTYEFIRLIYIRFSEGNDVCTSNFLWGYTHLFFGFLIPKHAINPIGMLLLLHVIEYYVGMAIFFVLNILICGGVFDL